MTAARRRAVPASPGRLATQASKPVLRQRPPTITSSSPGTRVGRNKLSGPLFDRASAWTPRYPETGDRADWDVEANAGLENLLVSGDNLPYVVKSPWISEYIDQIFG